MDIENIFEENKLNLNYGEPASGKSTLALQYALQQKGKVVFLDVEKSASIERMKQIGGNIDNIVFFKPKNLEEQGKIIFRLEKLNKLSLIVVDTLGYYYRTRVKKDVQYANKILAGQLRKLKDYVRDGITVIINNQVYSDLEGNIKVVGGDMVRNWSDRIIHLKKEPRTLAIEKPEDDEKEISFKIEEKGIIF
jgi:RecA/RadA recombinase